MKKFLIKILCAFVPSKKLRKQIRKKLNPHKLNNENPVKLFSKIGKHSYYGGYCICSNPDSSIGAFCSIAVNVSIGARQHPTNWLSSHPFQYYDDLKLLPTQKDRSFEHSRPVTIGNDVWIGNNAIIMNGVNIADGAIVGSNAVVTKDVPAYAIVVGVPAKIIRYRFETNVIEDLLKLKWWNLEDNDIANLPFEDINACITALKKIREYSKS